MKRALLIAAVSIVVLLILVALSGPLLTWLGVQLPFYIVFSPGEVRLVRATAAPASQPSLAPGTPMTPAGDAMPVIVDTDMAPDDWMAILYLLQQPGVDVKAIAVAGTGEAHCVPGVQNALDLAALAGRGAIPVACGRETPLQGDHAFPSDWREAVDGMLGLALPRSPEAPYEGSAAELLAGVVEQSPEKVHILTLGPLTNVAEALEAHPELVDNLSGITIMGGAVNVPGNVRASADVGNDLAEWNVYVDPHALAVVLGSGAPVTLVPLDATGDVPVTSGFYKRLKRDRGTPAAEFVYRVLTQQEAKIRAGGYSFWDPFAAAVAVDGSLATFAEVRLSVIEEEGPESGRTAAGDAGQPVRVAVGADAAGFETLFLDGLNGRSP
ncbi:MAG TPA: nucleoside hydrolase [Anaerolineae bacterium]|nr:nucleoside hydrolase [Anaerolineae bacterium]